MKVFDCSNLVRRDEKKTIMYSNDAFAPVGYLRLVKYHLEEKEKTKATMESKMNGGVVLGSPTTQS